MSTLKKDLYCSLGHLVVRNGALVCGGAGHSHDSGHIDLTTLLVEGVRAGQIDLNDVVGRLQAPAEQLFTTKPPRHEAKLVFELDEVTYPNDNHIVDAAIADDGRIWVETGWVPDDVDRMKKVPNKDDAGARLRIEGVDPSDHYPFFGPYQDVGCVCIGKRRLSFISKNNAGDYAFHVYDQSAEPGEELESAELPEEYLPAELPEDWTALSAYMNMLPRSAWQHPLLRWMSSWKPTSSDIWQRATYELPGRGKLFSDNWKILRGTDDDPRVCLQVTSEDRVRQGPAWDAIKAVRGFVTNGTRTLVYVAQRGNKVYKVTVRF